MIGGLLLAAAWGLSRGAEADMELVAPDGRRILLRNDNTWRYAEDKKTDRPEKSEKDGDKVADKVPEQLLLRVESKLDLPTGCRFGLQLANKAPYEVRSLVPEFTAYKKTDDVVYDTVFMAFSFVKPGDTQYREIRFAGIACAAIGRVKVMGADRCDMQDLGKFSDVKGHCLARVRVEESDLVRIAK